MKHYKINIEFSVKTAGGIAEANRLAVAIETAVAVQTMDRALFMALEDFSIEDVYEDWDEHESN